MNKKSQGILDYIKSQEWFFGVRADESLLFYSAKRVSYAKYIKKEYGIKFAETLLVPLKKGCPIRVFNLFQAKRFHAISNKKILKNPRLLVSYIKKNNIFYKKVKACSKKFITTIEEGNYHESIKLFNKIINFYEIINAQFIIIFSLGLKLTENKDNLKNIKDIIKKHDTWRNNVAFKDEAISKDLSYFFRFLIDRKRLKLSPALLMEFLTINEIQKWFNGKLTDAEIKKAIKSREDYGFVYLNLRSEKQEIIDNPAEIMKIRKYFLELDGGIKKIKNINEIVGQVAYGLNTILRGKVLIIKDKLELKNKSHLINGKILISTQTTPHYIPYLKEAKAIITDEGGLTCHAIMARELKIPCIIGTKIATKVLKDGDLVEVDANEGVVRILKR